VLEHIEIALLPDSQLDRIAARWIDLIELEECAVDADDKVLGFLGTVDGAEAHVALRVSDIAKAYDYMKDNSLNSHGLGVTGGLQYEIESKNKNHLVLGVTFEPKTSINSTYIIEEDRAVYRNSSTIAAIKDTVNHVESSNNGLQVPMSYGAGFSYSIKNKMIIGFCTHSSFFCHLEMILSMNFY